VLAASGEIAALNKNLSGLVQHGTTVVSDAAKNLKSYLVAAITASETAPEAVKKSFLNESFGYILSITTLTSRSPALQLAGWPRTRQQVF
jgi:hypothetical protein